MSLILEDNDCILLELKTPLNKKDKIKKKLSKLIKKFHLFKNRKDFKNEVMVHIYFK